MTLPSGSRIVLDDRRPHPRDRQRRAVQRVGDLRALLAGDAEADVGAARLVVAEPRDRRDLEPGVGAGCVHLDVEAAVVALAHVAGADLDDPVRQLETGDQRLGSAGHLHEQGGCLLGRSDGEDLDLVELVGAQHATRVTPGRARLAAVARRVGHHQHRHLLGLEDLAGVDRGQWHLGRGDAPQVVALDGVGVVGELRQLAGRGEGRRRHQRRRADLFEPVDVAVERVLAQRTRQRGAGPALHREHRPADLRRPFVVEDAERLAGLPVGHPAVLGEVRRQADRALDDRVLRLAGAVGSVDVRQVGDAQQHVAQVALHDLELVGEHPLVVTERPAAQLQLLGAVRVAGAAQLPDRLRQIVDFGPDGIALGDDVARQRIEGDRPLQLVEHVGLAAAGQGSTDGIGVGAQQTNIDHRAQRLPVLSGRGRGRFVAARRGGTMWSPAPGGG